MTKILAFHASPIKFDKFSKEFIGSNTDTESTKLGFFFTKHKQVAMSYFSKGMNQELSMKEKEEELQSKINNIESEKKIILNDYKKTKSDESIKKLKAISIKLKSLNSEKEKMDSVANDYVLNNVGSKDLQQIDDAYLYKCYLKMENPYVYDYGSDHYEDKMYTKIIKDGISKGHDSIIIKNTYNGGSSTGLIETDIYVVFEPEQIEIVEVLHSNELSNEEVYECKHIKRFGDFIKEKVSYYTQDEDDEYQITKVTVDDYHQYERCDGILYELSIGGDDKIVYVSEIEHTEENEFYEDQVDRYVKYLNDGGILESFPVQESPLGDAYNLEGMLEYLDENFDTAYDLLRKKHENFYEKVFSNIDTYNYEKAGIDPSIFEKIRTISDLRDVYNPNDYKDEYYDDYYEDEDEDSSLIYSLYGEYPMYWTEEYYNALKAIIEYFQDNKEYTLTDMNHRFMAVKELGVKRVYIDPT